MEKKASFEVSCFNGNVKKDGGLWRREGQEGKGREGINPVKGGGGVDGVGFRWRDKPCN